MDKPTVIYQLQTESIWGTAPASTRNRKVYYSIPQALKGLKMMFQMSNSFKERYLEHKILIHLVYLENGEQIARQRVFINL